MGKVNTARIILGGILAGVLIFLAEGGVHMGLLSADWQAWKQVMDPVIHAPAHNTSMALFAGCALVTGLVGMWIYAGIRPRYGAGPKTALLAGFITWALTHFTSMLDGLAMGVVPH